MRRFSFYFFILFCKWASDLYKFGSSEIYHLWMLILWLSLIIFEIIHIDYTKFIVMRLSVKGNSDELRVRNPRVF